MKWSWNELKVILESTPLHVMVDDPMFDAQLLEGVDSYAREFWRKQYYGRDSEARANPVVHLCCRTDELISNGMMQVHLILILI